MDNNTNIQLASNDEILIYQSQDGIIKIDVLFENETVWLNQNQLCTLFGKSKATISEHIKHIFEEGELDENVVVRKFRTTAFSSNSPSSKICLMCSLIVAFDLPNSVHN